MILGYRHHDFSKMLFIYSNKMWGTRTPAGYERISCMDTKNKDFTGIVNPTSNRRTVQNQ